MSTLENHRVALLTALGAELERRGRPSWVTAAYGTHLLRCVRLHPRRTILVACVPASRGAWVFIWPGRTAPAGDVPRAAALVAAYLAD